LPPQRFTLKETRWKSCQVSPTRLSVPSGSRCDNFKSGGQPTSPTRSMSSIGQGVYELKESDERAWYRAIYLSRIEDRIYVLHCFEKESRKTDRRDIAIASQRLKLVKKRLQEQKSH